MTEASNNNVTPPADNPGNPAEAALRNNRWFAGLLIFLVVCAIFGLGWFLLSMFGIVPSPGGIPGPAQPPTAQAVAQTAPTTIPTNTVIVPTATLVISPSDAAVAATDAAKRAAGVVVISVEQGQMTATAEANKSALQSGATAAANANNSAPQKNATAPAGANNNNSAPQNATASAGAGNNNTAPQNATASAGANNNSSAPQNATGTANSNNNVVAQNAAATATAQAKATAAAQATATQKAITVKVAVVQATQTASASKSFVQPEQLPVGGGVPSADLDFGIGAKNAFVNPFPGFYAQAVGVTPDRPTPNEEIGFYVTFLNNTDQIRYQRVCVEIYRPDAKKSFGITYCGKQTFPPGQSTVLAKGWQVTGLRSCATMRAHVITRYEGEIRVPYLTPKGNELWQDFVVCP